MWVHRHVIGDTVTDSLYLPYIMPSILKQYKVSPLFNLSSEGQTSQEMSNLIDTKLMLA